MLFVLLSIPEGCTNDQFQIESVCLTLNTDVETWSMASSSCSQLGDRTLFTPSLDAIEDLIDIVSEDRMTTTKWLDVVGLLEFHFYFIYTIVNGNALTSWNI